MKEEFDIKGSDILVPLQDVIELHDAAFIIGETGIVEHWSVGMTRMFGYSEMDMLGYSFEDILKDEVKPYHKKLVAKFWDKPQVRKMSQQAAAFEGVGRQGKIVWAQIALMPLWRGEKMSALGLLDKATDPSRATTQTDKTAPQMFMSYFIASPLSKQLSLISVAVSLLLLAVAILVT